MGMAKFTIINRLSRVGLAPSLLVDGLAEVPDLVHDVWEVDIRVVGIQQLKLEVKARGVAHPLRKAHALVVDVPEHVAMEPARSSVVGEVNVLGGREVVAHTGATKPPAKTLSPEGCEC